MLLIWSFQYYDSHSVQRWHYRHYIIQVICVSNKYYLDTHDQKLTATFDEDTINLLNLFFSSSVSVVPRVFHLIEINPETQTIYNWTKKVTPPPPILTQEWGVLYAQSLLPWTFSKRQHKCLENHVCCWSILSHLALFTFFRCCCWTLL